MSSAITVDDLNKFFTDKVAAIRAGTADAPDPLFTATRSGVSLSSFSVIPVSDVVTGIMKLPDKSSAADPLPVPVLKQVATDIAPFLTELFNRSLAVGHFPLVFKEAFVTPVLKKPGLDTAEASSYRPISNLPVISKLLERLVTKQLTDFLQSADLLPSLQSGFRPGHSTETAALRVFSDILEAVDSGDVAALVLLDLSAAFDTVDHAILCRRLQVSYGLGGPVLDWFRSYLHGRSQYVRRGTLRSPRTWLTCGVPQGSVLGPILFILYTADLVSLVEQHGFHPHLYANYTQVYGSCRPSTVADFQVRLSACVDDIAAWMLANRLHLKIPARLTCSGERLLVVVISCPLQLSGSGLTSSSCRPQSEISKSTLTPTSACDATSRKKLTIASPIYANCAVSDGQFQRQYTTRSSSLSFCHGSTTAMLCWWAYQPTCTTVCRQCSTLLRDPSPAYDALTTTPTHLPVSTG